MDNFGNGWDSFMVGLAIIGFVNMIAIPIVFFITVRAFVMRLPKRGLMVYWLSIYLIVVLGLCFDCALHLYFFSSPVLLLVLRFHEKIDNSKYLAPSNVKTKT